MFTFTLLLICLPNLHAEIFTSMADMEQMVLSEKNMLLALKHYISAEEKKLQDIKQFMTRVNEALQYVNESDVGKYLGNPVNSYLMLKRFNVDWKHLEKTLEKDVAEDFNAVFEEMKPFFPTIEDHQGAMDALFRLQNTYNLPSHSLAKGIIPGVTQTSKHPLSFQEIYELGMHAYNTKDWEHSSEWFQTALNEMGSRLSVNSIEKVDVMDYLAYALFQDGQVMDAYHLTKKLVSLKPQDVRLYNNLEYFETEMKMLEKSKLGDMGDMKAGGDNPSISEKESRRLRLQNYEKLCRGEVRPQTKREQRKMKCWYKGNHPNLILKPQKIERLWVNPEIVLLRQIISPSQNDWIRKTAYPMLRRATIQDPITGKLRHADYRVSKSAWLSPYVYDEIMPIKLRAEAATGLDLDYAEHLQIANYGIGGHYEPHFDHARDDEDKFTDLNMGNRIATLLIYLSDVKAGGPTVFTNAQAAVYPSKNDAVFWYNLKRNGDSNEMTRHAACPVLVGQKWVSNWWIHEYGQAFKRKCALNRDW